MLILVRKVQQSIWIEGDIYVKVLSVERDRVKLGITAPDHVKVMREELFGDGDSRQLAGGQTNGTHRAAS
ncbi:MAG: carbon storage regulator [Dehalococcoidia bacterium]|nr:carbon storage regulator [Dehalococcoidia bacterium]